MVNVIWVADHATLPAVIPILRLETRTSACSLAREAALTAVIDAYSLHIGVYFADLSVFRTASITIPWQTLSSPMPVFAYRAENDGIRPSPLSL